MFFGTVTCKGGAKQGAQGHTTQHYIRWRRDGGVKSSAQTDPPSPWQGRACVASLMSFAGDFCHQPHFPRMKQTASLSFMSLSDHLRSGADGRNVLLQSFHHSADLPYIRQEYVLSFQRCFFVPRSETRITEDETFYTHITFYLLLNIHSFKLSTLGCT